MSPPRPPGPRSTTTTWSASRSASSIECVVSTTATPSRRAWVTRSHAASRACGSSPALGSSRKSTSGRPTTATASASRCRCPPDSRRTGVRANASRPSRCASAPTGSGSACIAATCRSTSSARAPVGRPPSCSITPTRGRSSARWRTGSRPSTRTEPASGTRRPPQHSTVVVLPAPFGPSTAVMRPAAAVKVSPSTATVPPYRRTSPRTSRAGAATPPGEGMPSMVGRAPGRRGRTVRTASSPHHVALRCRSQTLRMQPETGVTFPSPRGARRTRVALYGHDTVGLGHLRRNLALAAAMVARPGGPPPDVLVLSGAPTAGAFTRPTGVDLVVLPEVGKRSGGGYGPGSLRSGLGTVLDLRSALLGAALAQWEPDLLVVDKVPRGLGGELEPALRALRRRGRTRTVLGLREVLDDPVTARREWQADCSESVVRELYDEIWVYGDPGVHDLTRDIGLPADLRARTRFTGYLSAGRATGGLAPPCVPRGRDAVLGLVGGGEDGGALARAFAAAPVPEGCTGVLVTGPYLSQGGAPGAGGDGRRTGRPRRRALLRGRRGLGRAAAPRWSRWAGTTAFGGAARHRHPGARGAEDHALAAEQLVRARSLCAGRRRRRADARPGHPGGPGALDRPGHGRAPAPAHRHRPRRPGLGRPPHRPPAGPRRAPRRPCRHPDPGGPPCRCLSPRPEPPCPPAAAGRGSGTS